MNARKKWKLIDKKKINTLHTKDPGVSVSKNDDGSFLGRPGKTDLRGRI